MTSFTQITKYLEQLQIKNLPIPKEIELTDSDWHTLVRQFGPSYKQENILFHTIFGDILISKKIS